MISPSRRMAAVEPYRSPIGARMTPKERQNYLKLDFNEATYPPSPLVTRALQNVAPNYYPDMDAKELREGLAWYTGRSVDEIRVWNGSDAALRAICWAYLDVGDIALIREPTYSQFGVFVRQIGAAVRAVAGGNAFDPSFYMYDVGLRRYQPRVAYIVNPNNPTGIYYPAETLCRKLDRYPDTPFIVDEAYYEYHLGTMAHHLRWFNNLIVVRTLSKAFGLAGVRIGYTLSSPQVAETLDKVRNGKDVGALAQAAALAALDDVPYMWGRVNEVLQARAWTLDALGAAGIDYRRAAANFILIKTQDAARAVEDFRARGVLVRDRSYLPQLEGYIRVTIGTMEEMRRFVAIAKEVLSTCRKGPRGD